jgi:hypothetical protein
MVDRRLANATTSDPDATISVQTTAAADVDRPGTSNTWQSRDWKTHNGYYEDHSSVKIVINKVADWSVGKGANTTKATTQKIIDRIIGSGKDTFGEVIKNQIRVRHIDGDSYAEIVGGKGSALRNLKPLNPAAIKIYYNDVGMLDHYGYQWPGQEEQRFEKEEIFHLSLNRNADATHGTGDIKSLITFLEKIKQLDADMAVFFHSYVVPMILWEIKSSKTADIAKFKADHKTAKNAGTDIIIPEKAVGWEIIEVGAKSGVDPLKWRQTWVEEVTKGGGVPALIMAIEAGTTEASSKMVYLAWQQVIEDEQNYLEKQIKLQLGLDVTFEFPARIEENLGEDEGKDAAINKSKRSEVAITTTKAPTPKATTA